MDTLPEIIKGVTSERAACFNNSHCYILVYRSTSGTYVQTSGVGDGRPEKAETLEELYEGIGQQYTRTPCWKLVRLQEEDRVVA